MHCFCTLSCCASAMKQLRAIADSCSTMPSSPRLSSHEPLVPSGGSYLGEGRRLDNHRQGLQSQNSSSS